MGTASGPVHLSEALSDLIALKGLAQFRGLEQLQAIWNELAGEKIASQTRILKCRQGVLLVGVTNAPLLSELAGFHKGALLNGLQRRRSDIEIRDLKFRLVSGAGTQS